MTDSHEAISAATQEGLRALADAAPPEHLEMLRKASEAAPPGLAPLADE